MRIILARHAETEWNAEGRYQGRGFDIPLSGPGRAQALAMGARLASLPLARVRCSPCCGRARRWKWPWARWLRIFRQMRI